MLETSLAVVNLPAVIEECCEPAEDIDDRIIEGTEELAKLTSLTKTLFSEFDRVVVLYRSKFPHIVSEMADKEAALSQALMELQLLTQSSESEPDVHAEPEKESPKEEKEPEDSRKMRMKAIKKYYRRICNQCHPDKMQGLPNNVLTELSTIFLEAKKAYTNKDLQALLDLYASACAMRETATLDDDYVKAKQGRLKELQDSIERAANKLAEIRTYVIYSVYADDVKGHKERAKQNFKAILDFNMEQLNSKLSAVRRQVSHIKDIQNA